MSFNQKDTFDSADMPQFYNDFVAVTRKILHNHFFLNKFKKQNLNKNVFFWKLILGDLHM